MAFYSVGSRIYVYLFEIALVFLWLIATVKPFQFWWWIFFGFVSAVLGAKLISNFSFSRLRLWRFIIFLSIYFWSVLIFSFIVNGKLPMYSVIIISALFLHYFLNNFYHYKFSEEGRWDSLALASIPLFIVISFMSISSVFASQVFFGLSFWRIVLMLVLLVFLVSYIMQWFWVTPKLERITASLTYSLIAAELFFVLYLLPISIFAQGAVLTFAWVLALNGERLLKEEGKERKLWMRYLYAAAFGTILILLTSN